MVKIITPKPVSIPLDLIYGTGTIQLPWEEIQAYQEWEAWANLISGVPPMLIEKTELSEWSKLLNNLKEAKELLRAAGFHGEVKLLNSDKTLYITFKLPQEAGFSDKSDYPKMLRTVADVLELNIKSEIEEDGGTSGS